MSILNATHSFLPWARRGLASTIVEEENNAAAPQTGDNDERATIIANVHVKVNGNQPPSSGSPIAMQFQIIGPGDVIGIHKDAVVKTEPHNWVTNFEPHSFPFIDFYEEDFPWRYTPAKPTANNKKLRPWITLVVLKENEFTRVTKEGAPLNAIQLSAATAPADRPLPKNDELWAWAHVSINTVLAQTNSNLDQRIADLNQKLTTDPSIAISRIICPRKLEENTSYFAFLIPTYETGRLAGLGLGANTNGVKAQAPAWSHDPSSIWPSPPASNPLELGTFPVYYEWYFRTGATGDFEYLVRQVKPRIADLRVGKRLMDIQSPGYGLFYTAQQATAQPGAEWLEGALVVPGNNAPVFFPAVPSQPLNTRTDQEKYADEIKDFVNLGEDMLTYQSSNPMLAVKFPTNNDPKIVDDPVVAPPLYGRWHSLRNKADRYNNPNLWLNELNLDPRYRVAASLGGDYVRKNQELLMDEAWAQVGEVIRLNREAALRQLSMETSIALHAKHIAPQSIEQLLPMTSNVHGRISTGGGTSTLHQDKMNSSLPESAASSAFRKITRPTGVMVQRMGPASTISSDTMGDMIAGILAPVEDKTFPSTLSGFDLASLETAVTDLQNVSNPSSVQFNISLPAGPPTQADSTVAQNFFSSFSPFTGVFDSVNWQDPTANPNLGTTQNVIAESIDPGDTHPNSFHSSLSFNNYPYVPPTPDQIRPISAAPSFSLPMYEAVKELGTDFLIPNLHLIPQNSITILESNQKFIEAYLAGLNYEMGRELLWREYPTDQRGTYFQYFWNSIDNPDATPANTLDISPIHTWLSTSALGTHSLRTTLGTSNLVLAIRGDFLKKFPGAVIFAVKAKWPNIPNTTTPDYSADRVEDTSVPPKYPIFHAKVEPDITFLGFDITEADAQGDKDNQIPGWFFVIMERPGELRFGLDEPLPSTLNDLDYWSDLSWSPNHVDKSPAGYLLLTKTPNFTGTFSDEKRFPPDPEDVEWAEDSTAMAQILYQNPVKVLIHANEMIP